MNELNDAEKKSVIIKIAVSAVLLIIMVVIGVIMITK